MDDESFRPLEIVSHFGPWRLYTSAELYKSTVHDKEMNESAIISLSHLACIIFAGLMEKSESGVIFSSPGPPKLESVHHQADNNQ